MKKTMFICAMCAMMGLLFACGGQKALTKAQGQDEDYDMPCTGPDYMTTGEVLRANASAMAMDANTAVSMATDRARAALAASMEVLVKKVAVDYVNNYQQNADVDTKGKMESMLRSCISRLLKNTPVICNKVKKNNVSGKFTAFIAVELSGANFAKEAYNSLEQGEKLRIDYDYEKFKDTFKEGMEDFAKEKQQH